MPLSSVDIIQWGKEYGLDDIAIISPRRLDEDAAYMDRWIELGLHGEMSYLERNRDKRYDPRKLVPDCQSMVIALLTYEHSGHDYHRAMKSRLYELLARLVLERPELADSQQRIFCDSAPMLERRWAELAGLGTIAKNRQLVHRKFGSYVHIGSLLLPIALEESEGGGTLDLLPCQACHLCEKACPGKALDGEWDARKCIAYVTHKCIVCQQVCPLNNHSI